jgi:hypothetical protein
MKYLILSLSFALSVYSTSAQSLKHKPAAWLPHSMSLDSVLKSSDNVVVLFCGMITSFRMLNDTSALFQCTTYKAPSEPYLTVVVRGKGYHLNENTRQFAGMGIAIQGVVTNLDGQPAIVVSTNGGSRISIIELDPPHNHPYTADIERIIHSKL